eukprot:CAMPEP_0176086300 /NCGR_PEP_ID=MMETSP0120_2-20121206/43198_1 /TAXON_ID=160619 /ORGANISM="Kryptoperidinium foliaceum, Strain CCMP 1326" /LENGTH=302 /DNA_ID=CAMNT_0017420129 /DNA_START=111 /DNA_END=1015 /DNA_ORIENTATION=-
MNATSPLEEALPWSPADGRKVLVCDSVETDGNFLLHTFACQALRGDSGNQVWWITGRPLTERQVATALKKIGSEVAATYLRSNNETSPLRITCTATDIAARIQGDQEPHFGSEEYLREIYRRLKSWIYSSEESSNESCCWIILDDITSLASNLGDAGLVFKFVDSIQSLATRRKNLGVITRCSLELDQILLKTEQVDESKDKTGWFGAGGLAQKQGIKRRHQETIPWERVIESNDIFVDVVPLSSGYSREAHGRLVFTETPCGRGWGNSKTMTHGPSAVTAPGASPWNKFVINYCLQDAGVR